MTDSDKQIIIKLFEKNIRGKSPNLDNSKHCGKEGHWLETQLGIKHN